MLLENGRIVAHIYRCVCVEPQHTKTANSRLNCYTVQRIYGCNKSVPCNQKWENEKKHNLSKKKKLSQICSVHRKWSFVQLKHEYSRYMLFSGFFFFGFEISYGVIKITAKLILDVEIFGSTGSIMRTYFPMMLAQMKPVDNLLMHNFTWQIHRVIS